VIAVNLIPPARLAGLRVRRRIGAWRTACILYALGAGAAWLALAAGGSTPIMRGDEAAVRSNLQRREQELAQAKAELAAQTRRLDLARQMVSHPDWAKLLDVPVAHRPEGIAFERLDLRITRRAEGPKSRNLVSVATLRVSGLAASRVQAAQYAVTLQELGLFNHVSPAETHARPVPGAAPGTPGADLVGFSVTVELWSGGRKEGP
jgi:hypothetical protein